MNSYSTNRTSDTESKEQDTTTSLKSLITNTTSTTAIY